MEGMIGVEGVHSIVNLLGSSVWKFLLMWMRLVFAIVRLSHIPYWRFRRWGYLPRVFGGQAGR